MSTKPADNPPTREVLRLQAEALQAERLGDSLVRLGRTIFERTVERLREGGYPGVRFSFTSLLPHIDREHGTRITELAERMDISKQAVGQLVTQLEELGYVERRRDPDDGRARIVELTETGYGVLLAGLEVFAQLEAELEEALGADLVSSLRVASRLALETLSPPEPERRS